LRFDTLVARAVGPLWKMCKWFRPHWHSIGCLLATKGPNWTLERSEARAKGLLDRVELRSVASYPMPGTHSESVILRLRAQRPSE
jgi:16S rRNA (guanine527-N7)-methyltransferase